MITVVDLILLALLAAFTYRGVKNGFVRSILSMVAVVVAAFLASYLSEPVAEILYDGFFKASIETAIAAQLPDMSSAQATVDNAQAIVSSIPEAFANVAASMGIDLSAIATQAGSFDFGAANVAAEITEKVAQPVAVSLLKMVSFALLFLIAYVVLQPVVMSIARFFKLPVLRSLNRGLGAVVGAIKGLFFVVTVAVLLDASVAVVSNAEIVEAVNGSKIINLITSTDLFSQLMSA